MSAVIRPDELAAHIELLERARALHAMIANVREAGTTANFYPAGGGDQPEVVSAEELVLVLTTRLTDIETQMTNRNITLKRPDFPKTGRPIPAPMESPRD